MCTDTRKVSYRGPLRESCHKTGRKLRPSVGTDRKSCQTRFTRLPTLPEDLGRFGHKTGRKSGINDDNGTVARQLEHT